MSEPKLDGARLHKLRKRHGLTAEQLGQESNVSTRHVWRLERGTRGAGAVLLMRLALTLETTVEYLLGITDDDRDIFTLTGERRAKN